MTLEQECQVQQWAKRMYSKPITYHDKIKKGTISSVRQKLKLKVMELRFENTKAGTKVYDGKKHIKTIPQRYEKDFGLIDIDFSKKRLTGEERFKFEHLFFKRTLKQFEKYVFELIENANPLKCYFVNIHDGSTRYEMEYDNGVKIKIDKNLYDVFQEKGDAKFSNY